MIPITLIINYELYNRLKKYIYVKYISSLRYVPGPILGKMTGLYAKYYVAHGSYHTFLKELQDQYGPVVHFAPDRVMTNTKNSSDTIYGTYKYQKNGIYPSFDFGAPNIFSAIEKGAASEKKKVVGQILNSSNLKKLEPAIVQNNFLPLLKKLKELYETKGYCDINELIHQVLFTINGQLILSENLDLINQDESAVPILKWFKGAQTYGVMHYEFPILKTISGNYFGKQNYQQFIEFCKSKVQNRQKQLAKDDSLEFNDILQSFIINSKNPMTLDELAAEVTIGFIGGTDTTANTIIWILKLLLEHPDKLDRVRKEIDQLYKDYSAEEITYELIKKNCPYLEACISESMRLYPIAAGFLPRITPKGGVELEGYYLPEGIEVGIGTYAYHRSNEIWENSDQFIPERFLDSSVKSNYLPFLIGPGSCAGREFAWLAMFHFLSSFLYYFDIQYYHKGATTTPYLFLVLKLKEQGMILGIKPRNELKF
ncbi:cytochrome P450 [Neoconidiobolus thromboides FSU 785]|nr:cytochrome P450 [Neoconidiobolus thromboides FSU 785]